MLYGQFGDRRDSIAMKHIGLLMMHGQLGVREGRVSLEPGNEQVFIFIFLRNRGSYELQLQLCVSGFAH